MVHLLRITVGILLMFAAAAAAAQSAQLAYEPVGLGWSGEEVERASAVQIDALAERAGKARLIGCSAHCARPGVAITRTRSPSLTSMTSPSRIGTRSYATSSAALTWYAAPVTFARGQTAGDVVVVDVGLEDVGDSHTRRRGQVEYAVDVPLWVDHERDLAVMGEVAAIPQRRGLDGDDGDHGFEGPLGLVRRRLVEISQTTAVGRGSPPCVRRRWDAGPSRSDGPRGSRHRCRP